MLGPFSTTGIGSMPHTEVLSACEFILQHFDIPFWPQMPKYSFNEQMIPQFSEGLPGVVFDSDKVYIRKDEEIIVEWLSNYHDEMVSPMSESFAVGLYGMQRLIKDRLKIFKGQITGPVTFTLSLKDEDGKLVYFDETLRELCLMHLKAKVRWQIEFLRTFAEDIIIFLDEPILQAVGTSAYISVEQDEATRLIKELVSFIKSLNAKAGIHCCGRTDWKRVLALDIDILSFDAFSFFDFFKIYRDEIAEFLDRNGYIAWGFVPTTDDLNAFRDEEIIEKSLIKIDEISKTLPLIRKNSLLTPSCGMGSLDISNSERICRVLKELKSRMING